MKMTATDYLIEAIALVLTALPITALPFVLWGATAWASYGGSIVNLIYNQATP